MTEQTDLIERLRNNAMSEGLFGFDTPDPLLTAAADEIERLRSEVERLRADAERYRALRSPAYLRWPLAVFEIGHPANKGKPLPQECIEADLDAAIDAAMRVVALRDAARSSTG